MFICCWNNKMHFGGHFDFIGVCMTSGVNLLDTGCAVSGCNVTAVSIDRYFISQVFRCGGHIINEFRKGLPRL